MSHAISPTIEEKFAKLADLLEQASRFARELSQAKRHDPIAVPELKRPAHVPPDEEWFWSDEWQAGEREANQALAQGDYLEFDSIEDALAELHRHV